MNDLVSRQKIYLFTDLRHICCGDLEWRSPTGELLPVVGPPEPRVEAFATTGMVPHGIRLVAQPALKTDPSLQRGSRGSRVIYDGGVYRSWSLYPEYPPKENLGAYTKTRALSVSIIYTESNDGFEWAERARSSITTPGWTAFDGFTMFIDPKAPAAERYKAVFMAWPPEDEKARLLEQYKTLHPRYRDGRILRNERPTCIYAAVSPDGLRWEGLSEPLMIHYSDTDTTVYYDEWLDRYVMYTRLCPYDRRTIGRAEAEDFRHWGPVQPLIWPGLDGPLSDDVYTNARCAYPGAPEYHLMFPAIYHRYSQDGDIALYSSADGICWNKVPGGPVIRHGEVGEWDSAWIGVGKDLVPFGPDRVAIAYGGTSFPHKYPRWPDVLQASHAAWAWWPKGRLCAVVADEEGEFFTFPVIPMGRELRLNLRTERAGEVRVGVFGVSDRSVNDCDPLVGDSLAMPVHWKGQGDILSPEDRPITLHFKLRAAELFGFEWV